MNVGIDISVLSVAKTGVWNYHYHLLNSLIRVAQEADDFVLVDCPAVHGQKWEPSEISSLTGPRVSIRRFGGLRHRKLSRSSGVQESSLYGFSRRVDSLLDRPWSWAARTLTARQFSRQLTNLDIFHVSDILNYKPPGAKTVTTIHDLSSLLYPSYHTSENIALLSEKYRFAQEEADVVIAVSESTKEDVVNHLGIDPQRVQVVYNGYDPRFRPLPAELVNRELLRWNLLPDDYLLHVGSIEPRKNLVRLLEAYSQVRGELGRPPPKLVLAGPMGWKTGEFVAQIDALDLRADVLMLGSIESNTLPVLYNGARVMIYPSLYEGFGLPPLEAMACGAPVITSNVSSLPEVVGDAAMLIDPLDTNEMAQAILFLATNPDQRSTLREAGLKRAELFSWDKAALETLAIYRRAVAG